MRTFAATIYNLETGIRGWLTTDGELVTDITGHRVATFTGRGKAEAALFAPEGYITDAILI